MKTNRAVKLAATIAAGGLVTVLLLLAVDGLIAVNRLNPVPEAQAAATNVELLQVRTVHAEGGLLGSSAVVEYDLGHGAGAAQLKVRLRRPLLSPRWEAVSVETIERPDDDATRR